MLPVGALVEDEVNVAVPPTVAPGAAVLGTVTVSIGVTTPVPGVLIPLRATVWLEPETLRLSSIKMREPALLWLAPVGLKTMSAVQDVPATSYAGVPPAPICGQVLLLARE